MPAGAKPGGRRGGRQKGSRNRIASAKKPFLHAFVMKNTDIAQECWEKIEDPRAKFEAYLKAAEFVFPKLGRVVDEHGADVQPIVFRFEEAP